MSSVQFLVGKTLGKYKVLEHIGHGGMAEVYKGIQEQLDRLVAIKVLHPFLADEEGFVIRFQREARIVATLRHQNIVQVYDFDENKELGIYYMVMEYIDGPTLKQRLSKGPLPPEEAARIGAAIADALDYAHKRDMVHRDIKPANIMFTSDGNPVLTDFGIAKMMSLSGLTASGAMVGTPAYMAPEVGMGRPGTVASDIYSLGVVLYQMVTGRLPFESDSPMGMVMQHINDPPPPPSQFVPDIPPELEAIILHALEKDPEARFKSAGEMAAALRFVVQQLTAQEEAQAPELSSPAPPPPAEGEEDENELLLRTWPTQAQRQTGTYPSYTPTSYTPTGYTSATPITPSDLLGGLEEETTSPEKPRSPFARRLLRAALTLAVLSVLVTAVWLAMGRTLPTVQLGAIPIPFLRGNEMPAAQPPTATPLPLTPTATASPAPTETPVPTFTPFPTFTPAPTDTPSPTPIPLEVLCAFRVRQERVQIEPGSPVAPETTLVAYIPLRNTGRCNWPDGLELVLAQGEAMGTITSQPIEAIPPGEQTTIILPLRAPAEPGTYEARWEIRRQGEERTLGSPIVLSIEVREDLPTPTPFPPARGAEPTSTPQLTISDPELLDWHEDMTQGKWYATVRFRASGGTGVYRYYLSEMREDNLSKDGIFSFEAPRCAEFPMTILVLSGEDVARWTGTIPYPAPEQCR